MSISGSEYVDITAVASTGLTSSQFCFVRTTGVDSTYSAGNLTCLISTGSSGSNARAKGILQNDPDTGQAAIVRIGGLSKLVAGAAIAVNDFVCSSTGGTGLVANSSAEWAVAVAESASTAAGQIISVRLLNPGLYFEASATA